MNTVLSAGPLRGTVRIPASKSQAHRLLICSALGNLPVAVHCDGFSRDIIATAHCLQALGAVIETEGDRLLYLTPGRPHGQCTLPCGESGSTLRFLLPVAAALGAQADFILEGRLPQRPLAPLDTQLSAHGVQLARCGNTLQLTSALHSGSFTLPGNVSSQYISGLLLALPLLDGDSTLRVSGCVESEAYIAMTEDALHLSGIRWEKDNWTYHIPGRQTFSLPGELTVEGDWSNAAFFLCAGALSPAGVRVTGLDFTSHQGDRAVVDILRRFGAQVDCSGNSILVRPGALHGTDIDAAAIPDLIPVLSVVAACAEGVSHITGAGRLRLKESDRLRTTSAMLRALGGCAEELDDALVIHGGQLLGGTVDSANDHRIAMSAAVAACRCPVTVLGSQCVEKSYPRFWQDYAALKGETT